MGDVIVRLTVNKKNGTYEAKILGHEGGTTCSDGLDEDIIQDLLNAEIPGYGLLADPNDGGHTKEYFEEKQAKQKPHAYKAGEDDEDDEIENKQVGLGYGV